MATSNPAPNRPSPVARRSVSASGLGEYLRGVREELLKAKWPTRAELIRLTQVVLALITIVALYCGALDLVLGWLAGRLFNLNGGAR